MIRHGTSSCGRSRSIALGLQTDAALGAVLIGLAAALVTVVLVIRKDAREPAAEDQHEENSSTTVT